MADASAGEAPGEIIRVRHSKVFGGVFAVIGVALLATSLATGANAVSLIASALLVILGIGYTFTAPLVVTSNEVQLRNMLGRTMRRFPIASPSDLAVDRSRLYVVSTGRRVYTLSFLLDRGDVERLKERIGQRPA